MDIETFKTITSVVTPFFLFTLGIGAGVIGWYLRRQENSLADGFERIEKKIDENRRDLDAKIAAVERDYMELKAEMPRVYVLRDDYLRNATILENKIDAIGREIRIFIEKQGDRNGK